ncbi:MAG TPA: GntR family transcriptional regulator [Thermoanaerobaculia bacterium]
MLQINPTDAVPIWKQVEAEVRRLVALGAFKPGTAVPSVRELAQRLRINPATVAKAYQRLTDGGVLTVRRGEGTFVSDDPATPTAHDRDEALATGARRYAAVATTVGATEREAVDALRDAMNEMKPRQRSAR